MLKANWLDSLEPVDYVRSAAIIIASAQILFAKNIHEFVRYKSLLFGSMGILLLAFPKVFMEFQVSP